MDNAEVLPANFRRCATVARVRQECTANVCGLDNLHFWLLASPLDCSLLADEAHKDNIENKSETIVPSPPPLMLVVTGAEIGKPQSTSQTGVLNTQVLNIS